MKPSKAGQFMAPNVDFAERLERLEQLTRSMQAARNVLKGRPRSTDRCPCGEMTKARAQKRGHMCEAKESV